MTTRVNVAAARASSIRSRISRGASRALQRVAADAWLLLQATAAATAAWLIARHVLDHPKPFFAPIAALIGLNASLGERGLNALRLLQGVVVGIVVGEATLAVLGGGYGSMALAILFATALARALDGPPIAVGQAAVSAMLVIAIAGDATGLDLLLDALTGAGVALVFSQLLFVPEPVALLRRAETAALEAMAHGLALTAQALEQDDEELAEDALGELRDLPDRLTELRRVRRASMRIAHRHTGLARTAEAGRPRERERRAPRPARRQLRHACASRFDPARTGPPDALPERTRLSHRSRRAGARTRRSQSP
jgi:uncharacterized membrane protein YgaE (UPF0421/DUF939 family)